MDDIVGKPLLETIEELHPLKSWSIRNGIVNLLDIIFLSKYGRWED
jgi:hypothetical protein